jgi:hypothetical protein
MESRWKFIPEHFVSRKKCRGPQMDAVFKVFDKTE